jgi:hypothetical protein
MPRPLHLLRPLSPLLVRLRSPGPGRCHLHRRSPPQASNGGWRSTGLRQVEGFPDPGRQLQGGR